jgi:hypothetical protein
LDGFGRAVLQIPNTETGELSLCVDGLFNEKQLGSQNLKIIVEN